MQNVLDTIASKAHTASEEALQAVNNTDVSNATVQDRIKQIKQNAIGAVLDNALTKAQTGKTMQEIEKIKTEMRAISTGIEQGWQRGNNEVNRTQIMERLGNAGLDLQDRNAILNTITSLSTLGGNLTEKISHNSWWSEDNMGNWQQGHSTQKKQ